MPESFDHKITNKIRSVFEQYDEPFNEHAWTLMKEKLSAKKKRRFILFIDIAKAASVLLIIGSVFFMPYGLKREYAFDPENLTEKENSGKQPLIDDNIYVAENEGYSDNSNNIIVNRHNDDENIADENKNYHDYVIDTLHYDNDKVTNIYAENSFENHLDTTETDNNKDSLNNIDNRPILGPDDENFYYKKKSDKKVKFALAFSSHYTSSDIGAKDNINIGGGFLTGYMLSDRISINSGVLIANHDLSSQSGSLFGGVLKADAENTLEEQNAYLGNVETEVQLVGLDIPLNIQINFEKFFVSTGISSLVYLKEKYTENYYVANTSDVYNSETDGYQTVYLYENVNNTTSEGAFQTFDFAKLINLSVGYKIPLKKGSLIFEPYAKIPTGSLTSYNISYGYGGLALKYTF